MQGIFCDCEKYFCWRFFERAFESLWHSLLARFLRDMLRKVLIFKHLRRAAGRAAVSRWLSVFYDVVFNDAVCVDALQPRRGVEVPQAQGEQWNRSLNSEQSFDYVCHSIMTPILLRCREFFPCALSATHRQGVHLAQRQRSLSAYLPWESLLQRNERHLIQGLFGCLVWSYYWRAGRGSSIWLSILSSIA